MDSWQASKEARRGLKMKGFLTCWLLVLWTTTTQQKDRDAGRISGGPPSVLTVEAFAPRPTYSFVSISTRSLLLRNKRQQEVNNPSQQRSSSNTIARRRAFGGSNYLDSLGTPPSNDSDNNDKNSNNSNINDEQPQQQQQQQQPQQLQQNSGGIPGPPQQSSQQPPQTVSPRNEIAAIQSGGSYLDHLQQNINQKAQQEQQQEQQQNSGGSPPERPQKPAQTGSPFDGIASFQSGSYLNHLQQSDNQKEGPDKDEASSSSAERFKYGGPQNMSSGSYLSALGDGSSNVSPWDRQKMNSNSNDKKDAAWWKQRPGGPKFLPVPQTPWEFQQTQPPAPPAAAPVNEDTTQPPPEQQFAAPSPPAPEEEPIGISGISQQPPPPPPAPIDPPPAGSISDEPATIDALTDDDMDIGGDNINGDDQKDRAALLDMLDSTRDAYDEGFADGDAYYENLVGEMIEGEGVVIPRQAQSQSPQQQQSRVDEDDDDSENMSILEDLAGDDDEYDDSENRPVLDDLVDDEDDMLWREIEALDEGPDNEWEENDANEPIYLDSLYDDDDEPIASLGSTTGKQDTVEPKQEPPLTQQNSDNKPYFGDLVSDPGSSAPVAEPDGDKDKSSSETMAEDAKSVSFTDKNIGAAVAAANTQPAAPWWSSPPASEVPTAAQPPEKEDASSKDEESDRSQPSIVATSSEESSSATVAASEDGALTGDDDAALAWEFNEVANAAMEATDSAFMRLAVELASSEECVRSSYPNPTVGAVLVADDGSILGQGFSSFRGDAIRSAIEAAGLELTAQDGEWIDTWPSSNELREKIASSTLYVTLEPNKTGRGSASPPIPQLIEQIGIPRVVIGSVNPVKERTLQGAAALYAAGISVNLGRVMREDCDNLIEEYAKVANGRLRRMARKHFKIFGRPLGFLHCSVVGSEDLKAFARHGNAFGTYIGGKQLSYRNFGSYELAPPPDVVWSDDGEYDDDDDESIFSVDFDDEDYQEVLSGTPIMPYYEQVDAVVATFPRPGNGPPDDDSVAGRLAGLRWLATHGCNLPPGVERVLVLDAVDLKDLPLNNGDPNLPPRFDIEAFWRGANRKQTRIILRRAGNDAAQAAAKAAAKAAAQAAEAAAKAAAAIDSGDVADCTQAAIECQKAARASVEFVQKELEVTTELRRQFEAKGVKVEAIEGGEPIDIMKFLGERNGHRSVVWRAGCWGERGVRAILEGAFQMVSAHLAVPAIGGRFWQLMIAENAVQAACGPQSKVKIFADQEDISLEYCDNLDVDEDCVLTIDGKPVRHVRLDCRLALVDAERPREFDVTKTQKITRKILTEEAPWFL